MSAELVIRDAEIAGRTGLDVRIVAGRIEAIGPRLPRGGPELDARGGALIPGLIDHHIHLLATAARADSVDLSDVTDAPALAARLQARAGGLPAGAWMRAVGYHEVAAGLLSRESLDALVGDHPVRVQDRTGALWVLNSPALELAGADSGPDCVERDAHGRPTGRVWRGDAWLGSRIGRTPPALAPLGARLAAFGVTGVMDASVTTGPAEAQVLADAVRAGDLPLRLGLMSGGPLDAPPDGAFVVGPTKIVPDERDPPPLDEIVARIAAARRQGRPTAVHCVAGAELALALAAFEAAGPGAGDRIEHGSVIPLDAIPVLRRLRLTVVTQPGFVFERGDRYLAEVDAEDRGDLYRCASLLAAGVAVAASSDAPYSTPDPWLAMRAARDRLTGAGQPLGPGEAVAPSIALRLFHGPFADPGGPSRRIAPGGPADLLLLKAPLAEALDGLTPDLVRATVVDGRLVHGAS